MSETGTAAKKEWYSFVAWCQREAPAAWAKLSENEDTRKLALLVFGEGFTRGSYYAAKRMTDALSDDDPS